MEYTVKTLRSAGLEARWGKTRKGAPILFARYPGARCAHQRDQWWAVDRSVWERMKRDGVVQGFTDCTLLGDFFSLPA